MDIVITGGSNGIGKCTVDILKDQGHNVVNIDWRGGDICADLGTAEGRSKAICEVREMLPDGFDGLISNAAIAGIEGQTPAQVVSVNYFGATTLIKGLLDLLEKKRVIVWSLVHQASHMAPEQNIQ